MIKVTLMWIINDFLAYSMLFEWSTIEKLVCPICMEDARVLTLKRGGKQLWFDYQIFFWKLIICT